MQRQECSSQPTANKSLLLQECLPTSCTYLALIDTLVVPHLPLCCTLCLPRLVVASPIVASFSCTLLVPLMPLDVQPLPPASHSPLILLGWLSHYLLSCWLCLASPLIALSPLYPCNWLLRCLLYCRLRLMPHVSSIHAPTS